MPPVQLHRWLENGGGGEKRKEGGVVAWLTILVTGGGRRPVFYLGRIVRPKKFQLKEEVAFLHITRTIKFAGYISVTYPLQWGAQAFDAGVSSRLRCTRDDANELLDPLRSYNYISQVLAFVGLAQLKSSPALSVLIEFQHLLRS